MTFETFMMIMAGMLSGSILGLIGAGSNILSIYILYKMTPLSFHNALVIAILNTSINSCLVTVKNVVKKKVNFKLIIKILPSIVIFSFIGSHLSLKTDPFTLEAIQGVIFIVIGSLTFYKIHFDEESEGEKLSKKLESIYCIFTGALIGFFNGYIGITGGIIAVPAIIHMGYKPKTAMTSSLAIITCTGIISVINYNISGSHIPVHPAIIFIAASLIGLTIGQFIHRFASEKNLKSAFSIFFIFLGSFVLYEISK